MLSLWELSLKGYYFSWLSFSHVEFCEYLWIDPVEIEIHQACAPFSP